MLKIKKFESDLPTFNPWKFKFLKVAIADLMHLKLFLSIIGIWLISLPHVVKQKIF